MSDLREKLLVAVTEASVNMKGVDLNDSVNEIHAKAIVSLVNAIVKESEGK